MAISLVGQAGIAGSSVASPQTITYSSTGGNTLIITGHLYDLNNNVFVAPTSITDTASNTWQVSTNSANTALVTPSGSGSVPPTASLADPDDGGTSHQSDWVAWSVGAAHVTSVTVAWAGGQTTFARIALAEYSGVVQFDNSWAGGSATAGASGSVSAALTVNVTGELAVGAVDFGGAGTPGLPAGWTQFSSSGGQCAYLIGPAIGAFSPTWTDTVAASYTGAAALFSPVALGGPVQPRPLPLLRGRAAAVKGKLASILIKPPTVGGPPAKFFPPHSLLRGQADAVKGKLTGQRGQPGRPSPFRLPGPLKGPAAARPGKLTGQRGQAGRPSPFTPPHSPLRPAPPAAAKGSLTGQRGRPGVPAPFTPPHQPLRGQPAARKGVLAGIVAPPPIVHANVPAPFFPPHTLLRGQAGVRARTPLTGAIAPPPTLHPQVTIPTWQGSTHMPAAGAPGNLILGANHTGTGATSGDLKGDFERSGD